MDRALIAAALISTLATQTVVRTAPGRDRPMNAMNMPGMDMQSQPALPMRTPGMDRSGSASGKSPEGVGLQASNPPDGATVAGSPTALNLAFAQPVRLQSVSLTDALGRQYPIALPAQQAGTLVLPTPELPMGAYKVSWAATRGHGRTLSGAFSFRVQ